MIANFFYSLFFTSAVFVHGIGIERFAYKNRSGKELWRYLFENTVVTFVTVAFSYLFAAVFFAPIHLQELTPAVAIVVFILVYNLYAAFVPRSLVLSQKPDFIIPLLCVLLAFFEGRSFFHALFVSQCALWSYCLFLLFLSLVNKHIKDSAPDSFFPNVCIILFCLSFAVFLLMSWGISWINIEVAK
ncbi:MAG: hypothetical protein Ta2A_20520 [Treponemataceae bacterium]|nr:MAG: hypothetical protein Ta2A_20520 [Treponemataceae bacterium]